jgi:parvulin-like peptidyl-prolyl isomerase
MKPISLFIFVSSMLLLSCRVQALLLRAQLAADAREAGYDKQQIVIDRMKLAAQSELAEAWVEHYIEMQPEGDFEQLAREYYELNKQGMMSKPKIDVSHILVSNEDRTDDEAKALADSIVKKIAENPASFDELVMTYSDDPSSATNKGKFFKVKRGDMVKEFEEAAFASKDGEISEPVKTNYGYHVIRLDAHIESTQMAFEDVKQAIMARERKNHADRIKRDYLSSLSSLDVEMTKEALEEMVRRQYGDDTFDSPTDNDESE